MLNKQTGCYYCFKTLDPKDTNSKLQNFLQCSQCDLCYHTTCWKQTNQCLNCKNNQFRLLEILPPPPLQPTLRIKTIEIKPTKTIKISKDTISEVVTTQKPSFFDKVKNKIKPFIIIVVAILIILWFGASLIFQNTQANNQLKPTIQKLVNTTSSPVAVVSLTKVASYTPNPTNTPRSTKTATRRPTKAATSRATKIPIPTNTPLPTNTPTPQPKPKPVIACTNNPQGEFADFWKSHKEELGCPFTNETSPLYGQFADMPFEKGHLFWIGYIDIYNEVKLIIATFGGQNEGDIGTWSLHQDTWNGEGICGVASPPEGRYLPDRGIAKIWCEIDGINRLGYAMAPKEFVANRGVNALQNFEKAIIFRDSDGYSRKLVYVLFRDTQTYKRMHY